MNNHETYMHEALLEAKEALRAGEFPVGSVMVYKGEIISRGHRINSKAPNENELDHAEIVALRKIFEQHPEKDRSKKQRNMAIGFVWVSLFLLIPKRVSGEDAGILWG